MSQCKARSLHEFRLYNRYIPSIYLPSKSHLLFLVRATTPMSVLYMGSYEIPNDEDEAPKSAPNMEQHEGSGDEDYTAAIAEKLPRLMAAYRRALNPGKATQ